MPFTHPCRRLVLKVERKHAFAQYHTSEREACVLRLLQPFPWAPRLLCAGPGALITTHVGERISSTTLPADWRLQAEAILRDLRSVGVDHNDLYKRYAFGKETPLSVRRGVASARADLMVRNGHLAVIDFNWATVFGNYSCAAGMPATVPPLFTPQRDADMLLLLERLHAHAKANPNAQAQVAHTAPHRKPPPPPPLPPVPFATPTLEEGRSGNDTLELHLLVLWDVTHPFSRTAYARVLGATDLVLVSAKVLPPFNSTSERLRFMNAFYEADRHGKNVNDLRGTRPFCVLYITSLASQRGPCGAAAAKRGQKLCSPVNRLKASLRAESRGRAVRRMGYFFVHGTDMVAESRANLATLGEDYDAALRAHGHRSRWANVSHALSALATAGVAYVVARDLPHDAPVCGGGDGGGGGGGGGGKRTLPGGRCAAAARAWSAGRYEVDIFVSDYGGAVRAMGGVPAEVPWKTAGMGGTRVAHEVLVLQGVRKSVRRVRFDVRSVDDGYLDARWLRVVLARREWHAVAGVYVMGPLDSFYTLLYHNVLHQNFRGHRADLQHMVGKAKRHPRLGRAYRRHARHERAAAARRWPGGARSAVGVPTVAPIRGHHAERPVGAASRAGREQLHGHEPCTCGVVGRRTAAAPPPGTSAPHAQRSSTISPAAAPNASTTLDDAGTHGAGGGVGGRRCADGVHVPARCAHAQRGAAPRLRQRDDGAGGASAGEHTRHVAALCRRCACVGWHRRLWVHPAADDHRPDCARRVHGLLRDRGGGGV